MVEAAPDAAMDNEMDEQMDDMEGQENDENGMDEEDEGDDENAEKNEYQKKDLVARPYESEFLAGTVKEVEEFTFKNQR